MFNKVSNQRHLFVAQALLIGKSQHAVLCKVHELLVENDVEGDLRLDERLLEKHGALPGAVVVERHARMGVEHRHVRYVRDVAIMLEVILIKLDVLPLLVGDPIAREHATHHPQALAVVGHGFRHLQFSSRLP